MGDPSSNRSVGIDTIFNTRIIEENNFNVTEHRGFLHGFVEALSVILVSFNLNTFALFKKNIDIS